jgi:molecular chaperone DnaK (HSP70)
VEQPTTQAEVLTMNTSATNTLPPPPPQHQAIKIQNNQQQDSEEEIEAIIKDELPRLHQENKRLWLMQEHMAIQRVIVRQSQIMQQQIKQERATQAEL